MQRLNFNILRVLLNRSSVLNISQKIGTFNVQVANTQVGLKEAHLKLQETQFLRYSQHNECY